MKHLKLFENFEVVRPLPNGDPLNDVEIKILKSSNVFCPEFILKEDNYYYINDHRCENIRDVPLTYIHALCSKFKITNYTINDDYSIDVNGNVFLNGRELSKLPLKFNKVSGSFNCSFNKLTTLEGSPKEVGRDFKCSFNKLTTLEGGPKKVGGDFYCYNNQLTTLEGGPKEVGRDFICRYNPLTSTEYRGIIKGKLIYR